MPLPWAAAQVFLEPGETQTVETMIKCISVASANGHLCCHGGTDCRKRRGELVAKMNERAKGLGMNNTTFINCCGLDTDGHMSTARDVALMSRELIVQYPQIHNYSTIWMDTITHVTRKAKVVLFMPSPLALLIVNASLPAIVPAMTFTGIIGITSY